MSQGEEQWNKFQQVKTQPGRFTSRARQLGEATQRHAHKFIIQRLKHAKEVRRDIGIWLLGVGVLIGAATLQFVLFQNTYSTVAPQDGGTYAEGVNGVISTFNPLYATDTAELSVSKLIFSSLFDYDETGHLRGDLAKTVQAEEAGKKYKVVLRDDAYWHDGEKVTAKDVLFTINLIKMPATNSPLNASWKDVKVQVANASTLEFTLPAVYAPFPNALTFPIVPEHLLKDVNPSMLREDKFSRSPIGSGPFVYKHAQQTMTKQSSDNKRHTIVYFNKNQRYYRGAPKLERMQLHAYSDQPMLTKAVTSQEVNAASGVSYSALPELSKKSNLTVKTNSIDSGVYLLFNNKQPQLNDVKVRQALQVGTDIDKLLTELPWKTQRLDTPFMGHHVNLEGISKPALNKNEAKKLLDEAGWKLAGDVRVKGDEKLSIRITAIKDADYEKIISALKKQWRELGIDTQVRLIDHADPLQNMASTVLQPRDYDVLIHELVVGADPDVFAYWHSSQAVARGLNFSNYNSGISDDFLASARSRIEPSLRDAKYRSFAKQWLKDAPAIGLYQSDATYVASKGSQNSDEKAIFISALDRYSNVQHWQARQGFLYKTP